MFKVPFYVMLVAGSLVNSWCLDICGDQVDGVRLAHPADCSRFIECHGGVTVAIRYCPFGLHYNRYESICDFKFRAGCDFSYALQLVGYDNANKVDCEDCRAKCHNGGSSANGIGPIRPPGGPSQNKPSPPGLQAATPCVTAPTPKPTPSRPTTPCATSTPSKPTAPTPGPTKPSTPPKPTAPTPCPTKPSTPPNHTAPTPRPTKPPTPPKPTPPSGSEGGNDNPKPQPPVAGPSGVNCANPGKCKGQKDGALFADESTGGFIVCQCQCEIKMPCPAGLVFNEGLQVCDWPQS